MFAWLKSRSDLEARASALHGAIVEVARAPHLYAELRVPDTLDGRLEMLVLHVVLVLDRLNSVGPRGAHLARALTEAYVVAMDDTMRAIGVGDLSVPQKVKKAAAKLYDRHRGYAAALARRDDDDATAAETRWHEALASVLAEVDGAADADAAGLARAVTSRITQLDAMPDATLLAGQL